MLDKMKKLFELRSKMSEIKQELAATNVEAEAAEGKIKIVINGEQKVQDLYIDDALIVSPNKSQLQNDLTHCLNEAIQKSQKLAADKVKEVTGLDIPNP